jgi:hypothetical protein
MRKGSAARIGDICFCVDVCRCWKDVHHAEGVSQGFREDVIGVYRNSHLAKAMA